MSTTTAPTYAVNLEAPVTVGAVTTRALNGHAWSSNIGWIKFGGLGGPLNTPFPTGGGTVATDARINLTNYNRLEGWARACAGMRDPVNCTDTVASATSGLTLTTSKISLNTADGLFEQQLYITNNTTSTVPGIRVTLESSLPGVTVLYRSSGTDSGAKKYLQHNYSVAPGQTVNIIAEYYDSSRTLSATPLTYSVQAISQAITEPTIPSGSTLILSSKTWVANATYNDTDLSVVTITAAYNLIWYGSSPEQLSMSGISYSDDNGSTWHNAFGYGMNFPIVPGWPFLDSGPPYTMSEPTTSRIYRLYKVPTGTYPARDGGSTPDASTPNQIIFDYNAPTTLPSGVTSAGGGQYTWTVPAGVTSVDVKVWGAGGGAGYTSSAMGIGKGGGGGELVVGAVPVSAGASYTIIIGGGGSGGGNGGDSSFVSNPSSVRLGSGGGKGAGTGAGGGTQGTVQGVTGFTRHSGGNGGTTGPGCGGGGAGGGGIGGGSWGYAGLYCNGQNGAGTALGGGPGATYASLGDGYNTTVPAYPNGVPGGGGSAGGVVDYTGYYMAPTPGAHGRVVITYTPQIVAPPTLSDPRGGWDGWISLSGTNYGVTGATIPTGQPDAGKTTFNGYSWGSDVVGWVNWASAIIPPCGTPPCVNLPGPAIKLSLDSSLNNTAPNSLSKSITRGESVTLYWDTQNTLPGVASLQPRVNNASSPIWLENPSITDNVIKNKTLLNLPVGTYEFSLRYLKTDGSLDEYVYSNPVTITVTDPDFSLSSLPLRMKKYKDQLSNTVNISVIPIDTFSSSATPVIFSDVRISGLTLGTDVTLSQPLALSGGQLTFQALKGLNKGVYQVTVTGSTAGGKTHDLTIPLTVTGDTGSFEEF